MAANLSTDVLSLLLQRLKLESSVAGAFDARGEYSVEIGEYVGLKLHLILKGEFWLSIDGEKRALHAREGDCVLLTNGRNARISKRPNAKKTVLRETLASKAVNGVMTLNGGGEVFGIGLHFLFAGHFPKIIFSQLPPSILVPSRNDESAALRWNIEKFRAEFMGGGVGRSVFLDHLAPIILLQILRSHVVSGASRRDWFFALTDPKLSRAIEAIHRNIRKEWTLESLARIANMSRSGFASNFKKQVGLAPIEYLTHWRVQVACDLLTSGQHDVAETADLVGYKSESAFSTAFKKTMKRRPGQYARDGRRLKT